MIASTHLVTGAAMGLITYRFFSKIPWPVSFSLVLVVGIFSHFFLDTIPHSEQEFYYHNGSKKYFLPILLVEVLTTFLAIYWSRIQGNFFNEENKFLLIGMVGGAFPDVPHVLMGALEINWVWLRQLDYINNFFHSDLQSPSFYQGFFPQVAVIVIFLTFLCRFSSDSNQD